ncbi:Arp complex subunit [Malassezia brasiliensis]|uniref:Arp2/3 complex 34 kDa subunit n=1 Tax=Malassezia brasiliensis TaxID=1821822 RepID=A0AAF0IMG5_9BASI|nr:Arp complex subunit [Malassezia brasiliensis]
MILLGAENLLIRDLLTSRFETPAAVDQVFSDFDGVAYHIESTKEGPLTLSMDIRCWPELVQQGVEESLHNIYGGWIRKGAEPGYNVTLEFNYQSIPPPGADRDALIHTVSLLKRNAVAAPFERAFEQQAQLEAQYDPSGPPPPGSLIPIHYRAGEGIYILPAHDRVTVVFSTRFEEEADRVFGKVFLQEFVDARRQPSIQNAPQVLYSSREPPLEIRSVPGLQRSEDTGYVTFVLFPRHFQHPDVRYSTISHIQLFRDYLHYHIKCSKAYMHSRMRYRVSEFLKVLNRAKPEHAEKQRKTASGRTFRQG